jgi:hypothetical protein
MGVFPIGEYRVVDELEAIGVISQHFPGDTEEKPQEVRQNRQFSGLDCNRASQDYKPGELENLFYSHFP